MNPNVGQPENPFMQLLSKLQSSGGQQAPNQMSPMLQSMMQRSTNPPGASPPGGAPIGPPTGAGQAPGIPGAQQPDVANQDASFPGANPGVTKNLLGALSQLHAAIGPMTDPDEIRMIRSIILMLTQLIQKDQEQQNSNTGRFNPQFNQQSNTSPSTPPSGPPAPPPGQSPGQAASMGGMPSGLKPGAPSPSM
jgi:hypothetical protein